MGPEDFDYNDFGGEFDELSDDLNEVEDQFLDESFENTITEQRSDEPEFDYPEDFREQWEN